MRRAIYEDDVIKLLDKGWKLGVYPVASNIHALPSAQPERKGKWTATYSDCGPDVWVEWKCSECGYVRKKGWEHTKDAKNPDALFCEMCGADMRGEQDD
jgi:hypothetical protein